MNKLLQTKFGPRNRRGVTLLFVLTLIVLFLLMGTSFMLIANQFRRSAVVMGNIKVRRDDARSLVSRAFYDVYRGVPLDDTTSPLRGHSILEDMYGYGLLGNVDSVAPVPGTNQIYRLTMQQPGVRRMLDDGPITLAETDHQYSGHLITFTSGPSAGTTCQVVAYEYNHTTLVSTFYLRPAWRDNSELAATLLQANAGDSLVMNGRPFSGTGAGGFDSAAAPNVAALGPEALLPNRIGETRLQFRDNYLGANGGWNFRSVNEDYDAPDYQNMFLAGLDDAGRVSIPSFHRDSLHAFHLNPAPPHRSVFDAFNTGVGTLRVDNTGDGNDDGIWIDIGLPMQTDVKGRVYRPLVSYTILDMDANLNLNFHGNPTQLDPDLFVSIRDPLAGGMGSPLGRTGRGHGVAEISLETFANSCTPPLDPFFASNIMRGNAQYPGRYGFSPADSVPGVVGIRDEIFPGLKFAAIPNPGSLTGNAYATAADLQGRFNMGVSVNSPVLFGVPLGMPVVDVIASPLVEGLDIAYEADITSSPYTPVFTGTAKDVHFSAKELEGVLRHDAPDANTLPRRLVELIGPGFVDTARHLVTTDSFEVPAPPQHVVALLNQKLTIADPIQRNNHINFYLAPEMLRGGKLNLNRSFDTYAGSGIDERIELARHLYILFLLMFEDRIVGIDYNRDGSVDVFDRRAFCYDMAQWAVNIVDFRDTDSIMTGFEFPFDPWAGWENIGMGLELSNNLNTPVDPNYGGVVWGCERPELLITESYAHHDRRTEDTPENQTVADGDDYDSALVPNAAAFFELYAPWIYSTSATANADNETPSSLYDGFNNLNIARTAPNGDPVWRIVATRKDIEKFYDLDDPFVTRAASDLERIVYFTQPAGAGPEFRGLNVYYPTVNPPSIPRGGFAVVGSSGVEVGNEYRTYLGRKNDPAWEVELDTTRRISLIPAEGRVEILNWDGANMVAESRTCVAIPINRNNLVSGAVPRSLGLSDPVQGYAIPGVRELQAIADGFQFVDPTNTPMTLDTPVDKSTQPIDWESTLRHNGLIVTLPPPSPGDPPQHFGFRVVHLQRLANPDLPHDPNSNPYRTVDVHNVDLLSFNGLESPVASNDPDLTDPPVTFLMGIECTSYERGESPTTEPLLLWREEVDGKLLPAVTGLPQADGHHFNFDLTDSLGTINDVYRDDFANAGGMISFPWLTWNNRPYESHLELASVPMFRSSLMLCKFTVNDTRDRYSPPDAEDSSNGRLWFASNFGHLPNFYGDTTTAGTYESLNLQRILDYVEVPSRFLGAETFFDSTPFNNVAGYALGLNYPNNAVSNMRYPGKINLNTIREETYNALMGGYANDLPWADFAASRSGTALGLPTDFPWVYRSAEAANYVPPGNAPRDLMYTRNGVLPDQVGLTSGPTLFRAQDGGTGDQPLFDFTGTASLAKDPDRSQYFQNEMRQRLGNMVTTRSSVFAIWITVGFFEVDQVTGQVTQVEMLDERFRRQRYRGFYIIDRSIPVACEPGQDHNVDRAVLTESVWEEFQ
ncbi:MAG: hypothetical protein KF851_18295 [Pirellulaceae bacterium]|nr:hypothetical protein [Pirellulaceae bacterium]